MSAGGVADPRDLPVTARPGTLIVALAFAVLAGCGYMGGDHSRARSAAIGVEAAGRPCAWLPDESDQWRLRRSAVREKVRELIIPELHEAELDAWLMVERDYQRDPMMDSLGITEPGDKAVLFLDGGGTQPRAVAFASSPAVVWQMTESRLFERVLPLTPRAVRGALGQFRPRRIGINYSARVSLGDGIATGTRQFAAWLAGRRYAGSFRSAEALAVSFRATRTAEETELSRQAARCAAEVAERVLRAGIRAGQSTAAELAWTTRAEIRAARLECESVPRVFLIRPGDSEHLGWPWLGVNSPSAIDAGDLVLLELDLRYAGVAAVVQRTAYIEGGSRRALPADIRRVFSALVEARGALAPLFRPGRTGAQVAADAGAWAQQHRLHLELLAHPVGGMPRDAGTLERAAAAPGPYDPAGVLADRPLQAGDIQLLQYRLTALLDNGSELTLSAADEGVVGQAGLDFLTPPPEALTPATGN